MPDAYDRYIGAGTGYSRRRGGFVPNGLNAPHIAAIQRELMQRHWSFRTDPYEVPIETYLAAHAEMSALMRDRGWPVLSADIGRQNFLLMGVPVCPSDAIQ